MKMNETILLEIFISKTLYPNLENCSYQWLILNDKLKHQIKLDSSFLNEKMYLSICSRVTINLQLEVSCSI